MDIKILDNNKEILRFLVKDVDHVFANTLRRIIMSELPTMAIDEVEFVKNDSALHDEIVAHRLGLIALRTDLKSYVLKKDCKCDGKGCASCQAIITLKSKGPCTVYAEELKIKDPKIKPVHAKTMILKLLQGQNIELQATAVLGIGKEHAKFIPALVYYNAYPEIKILDNNKALDSAKVCPKHVFRVENKKLKIVELEACDLCMACVEHCGDDAIQVKGSDKDFIFFLESWGQLKPKEILEEAIKIFDRKLNDFVKEVKKVK